MLNIFPCLQLIPLTKKDGLRRKVVNIWISGFLSEDMNKKIHWGELANFMPQSQIYALQWKSQKITNLVKFMAKACLQIVTAQKIKDELNKKFNENPFIPALESASVFGVYLAELIIKLFPNQFVNLIGYSLGTELVLSCVKSLIIRSSQQILNNIYLLGGVTDSNATSSLVESSQYPLSIYNCYTEKDLVLKHILNLCKPDISPIGITPIQPIPGHLIRNMDSSQTVSGHLSYMSQFDKIGRLLNMNFQ